MTVQPAPTPSADEADADADADDDFRARLRAFLAAHHPGRPPRDPAGKLAWTKAWLADLFDGGYAGPGWPREFGGMELPFPQQVIYYEEFARARVPGPLGTGLGIAAPRSSRTAPSSRRALARPDAARRGGLGPGLLGTGRRLRPAQPAHHRRAPRR